MEKERMNSNLRRKIFGKFTDFCKHSTLHGFYYFHGSDSRSVHVVWGFIVLSSFILCGFLSDMIWNKYVVDPTFTVVESPQHSITDIKFPAVVLCDRNMVYGPNTENITKILYGHGYNTKQIEEFYESIDQFRDSELFTPVYVKKMHHLFVDLGITLLDLVTVLKRPCEDLVVICLWRSKSYNCQLMFREVYTVFGFCCRFDVEYFRSNVKDRNVTFVPDTEISEALQVVVNHKALFFNGTVSSGLVKMYIMESNERVTLLHNSVSLTASTIYDVNINVWVIDSSPDVEALSMHSRKCLLESDKTERSNFYTGCITEFILRKVAGTCRCLPFNYTASELQVVEYMQCTWELMTCVYRTIHTMINKVGNITAESSCYERCDYVQYDSGVEHIKDTSGSNEYYSKIAVHFAQETCLKYRRQVLYTWDQMLANLGGIFGLCVGGSIISVIELLWFIVDVLFTTVVGDRNRKIASKKMVSRKIFTTNLAQRPITTRKHKLAFIN